MKRFRRWLVFKAHTLVHHSTLGWIIIKKKQKVLETSEVVIVTLVIFCKGFEVDFMGLTSEASGDATPCRTTGVTLHSHVRYKEI